ncbi:hypothetical protein [Pedobacter gandavensis]|uniref:hypothetical protein n=1 Tax=Pedobacter gandavensis TaxID=2679963 RepID=UPI00292F5A97|nr:hypothetical protein [Pedobacter gandavensis]
MKKDTKSLLQKFLHQLKFSLSEQVFEVANLKDSEDLIQLSTREVGADVMLGENDGSVPAPDGDYELSDGFRFKVSEGKISEILSEEIEDTVTEEVVELADEEAPVEDKGNEEIDALKAEIEALKEEIKALKDKPESATKEDVQNFQSQVKELNDTFKLLASIPVEFSKVDNTPKATNKKQDDLAKLANALKK